MTTIMNVIIPTPNRVQPQYKVYAVAVVLTVVVPYTYM
jgi:hypothetical protein